VETASARKSGSSLKLIDLQQPFFFQRNTEIYCRMVIGEALDETDLEEFRSIYRNEIKPEIFKEPGIAITGLLLEEC
jgi:hypothetical protein